MNIRITILSMAVMAALFVNPASVYAQEAGDTSTRPRIALVLSGGGALGLAHIGVLEVLEELHVPVDCVVGTSMGALVGGVYAAGVEPVNMRKVISETDLGHLFDDLPPRSEITEHLKGDDYRPLFDFTLGYNDGIQLPTGTSAGYKFELFLKELIGIGASVTGLDFNDLTIPYRAVATDLETGEMKVFDQGELPVVMRASMSLPGIVSPTEIDDRVYIDGGLVRNLPIDIGRELCGDVVIAVNLGTRPKTRHEISSSIDVALQSIVLLTEQNVKRSLQQLEPDDVLIEPDLMGYTSSSFDDKQAIMQQGVLAGRAKAKALSRFSLPVADYRIWKEVKASKSPVTPIITAISANTSGVVDAQTVLHDVEIGTGEDFNATDFDREIEKIYGRGDFSYVGYSIRPEADTAIIEIDAQSKPWGPGYLKFGLGAITDFNTPTHLNLAASYRHTWLNSLGAEWRNDMQIGYDSFFRSEFFQPLQIRDGAFIAPHIGARRNFIQYYQDTIRLGEFRFYRLDAGLDMGLTGSLGEFRIGPYVSRIKGHPDFGIATPLVEEADATESGLALSTIIDQLDSVDFPRNGLLVNIDILQANQSERGIDTRFTRAQAGLTAVKSFGKHTFSLHGEWGDELSGLNDLPVYELFKLGGPERLSGLFIDQLSGVSYQLATLRYYQQFASLPSQLGRGQYLGFSLETGRIDDPFLENPSDWISSGSLFWGMDTILGAVYLGYGRSDLGQDTWYFSIGPRF